MQLGQHNVVRVTYVEYFLRVKIQVFTLFITQVGVGIPVAYNFAWIFNPDGTMIGSNNHPYLFLGKEFQQVKQWRMLKPR